MDSSGEQGGRGSLARLHQFMRKLRNRVEVCELCAKELLLDHQHLLELEHRRVLCSCDACATLLSSGKQRYRRIPRDVERLGHFQMDEQEWSSLLIPIDLAFFVRSSAAGRIIAQYPSPAGVMESALDLEYWKPIEERNPVLCRLEPDVEALLVNRLSGRQRYYRAPIDRCFLLVGIMQTKWRGLSGGAEVWAAIEQFFAELDRSCPEDQVA
ncbi:MAG: DUF5947 family protein [Acidobacteriaceae bacterium]